MARPPLLFVSWRRHFVEGRFVVSRRSRGAASGELMTYRSLLLSSAALLLPITSATAQQPSPKPQTEPPQRSAAPVGTAPAPADSNATTSATAGHRAATMTRSRTGLMQATTQPAPDSCGHAGDTELGIDGPERRRAPLGSWPRPLRQGFSKTRIASLRRLRCYS